MAATIVGAFQPDMQNRIKNSKILLVGAGGIGCEVLKNLVLTGFSDLEVIDLDTIEVSNLNRQFLFSKESIGRAKSHVARESVLKFNPNVNIQSHLGDIMDQKYGAAFFNKFKLVINALDNKKARNHVNRMCLSCDIPLIESGTMGYITSRTRGQVEFIKKGLSLCYECLPKPEPKSYPMCTIRNTPKEPIHCVVWAKFLFSQLYGEVAEEEVSMEEMCNVEGITQKLSARQWAEKVCYEPKKLLKKIFFDDIHYLLNMEHLFSNKANKPIPLDCSLLDQPLPEYTNEPESKVLTREQYFAMFLDSAKAIKEKMDKYKQFMVWDKDDDDFMNFVVSGSNIRSLTFSIPMKSHFDIKTMAGNIVPAIATTNAIVAGQVVIFALRILRGRYQRCQNVFIRSMPNHKGGVFVKERILQKPNPKCGVCSIDKEILLEVDVEKFTLRQFDELVLRKKLNMVAPDILVDYKMKISSDENDELDMFQHTFLKLGVSPGALLIVDDYFQNYNVRIRILHKTRTDDDSPEFKVFGDLEKMKNSLKEKNDKKKQKQVADVDCVITNIAGNSMENADNTNNAFGEVKPILFEILLEVDVEKFTLRQFDELVLRKKLNMVAPDVLVDYKMKISSDANDELDMFQHTFLKLGVSPGDLLIVDDYFQNYNVRIRILHKTRTDDDSPEFKVFGDLEKMKNSLKEKNDKKKQKQVADVDCVITNISGKSMENADNTNNAFGEVKPILFEILLEVDVEKFTLRQFDELVLRKKLNMVAPDVLVDYKMKISSDENDELDMFQHTFLKLGVSPGALLIVDDYFQNYNVRIRILHKTRTDDDSPEFKVFGDLEKMKNSLKEKNDKKKQKQVADVDCVITNIAGKSMENADNTNNAFGEVKPILFEILLEVDVEKFTLRQFDELVLRKKLNMVAPDVLVYYKMKISSDENDELDMFQHTFLKLGVSPGALLIVDDYFQNYNVRIRILHKTRTDDDSPEFKVFGDLEKMKNSLKEKNDKKKQKQVADVDCVITNIAGNSMENADNTNNAFGEVKPILFEILLEVDVEKFTLRQFDELVLRKKLNMVAPDVLVDYKMKISSDANDELDMFQHTFLKLGVSPGDLLIVDDYFQNYNVRIRILHKTRTDDDSPEFKVFGDLEKMKNSLKEKNDKKKQKQVADVDCVITNIAGKSMENADNTNNAFGEVKPILFEILLEVDVEKFTLRQFDELVLRKKLNMVAPDVLVDYKMKISSDENDELDMFQHTFLKLGVSPGALLIVDDYFQNYNVRIRILHKTRTDDDSPEFKVFGDLEKMKNSLKEKNDKKKQKQVADVDCVITNIAGKSMENADNTNNAFGEVKPILFEMANAELKNDEEMTVSSENEINDVPEIEMKSNEQEVSNEEILTMKRKAEDNIGISETKKSRVDE